MPGFKQFVTGIFLFLPLTLFGSLTSPPLYMVALAFPAYGVQGVAMGWNRIHGVDPRVGSVVVPQAFAGIACGDHGSAYAETGRLLSSEAANPGSGTSNRSRAGGAEPGAGNAKSGR